jgi:hypothetical protein
MRMFLPVSSSSVLFPASSFIRGAYLRASLQSRFHEITLARSSEITSKWSSAEGYRGRERTDWNSYCVCVCIYAHEQGVRKCNYFFLGWMIKTIGNNVSDQWENKRQSWHDRHGKKHWPSLCSSHEKFAATFVIRKGTQFDLRRKWPYVSHVVE